MRRRLPAAILGIFLAWTVTTTPGRADPVPIALGIAAAAIVASNFAFDMPEYDVGEDFVNFGVGFFDGINRDNTAAEFRLEYWSPWTILKTRGIAGVFGTSDRGFGGYIGIRHDLYLTKNLVVSIGVAPTLYSWGDGTNLGSFALLRSEASIGYRFDNSSRLSFAVHHMSHGGFFSDRNPGVESIAVTYAIPVSSLFGK